MQRIKGKILIAAAVTLLAAAGIALAAMGGAGRELYRNTTPLPDGLSYTNTIYEHQEAGREESFLLTLKPGAEVYPLVMACDTIYGGMTVSDAVEYAAEQGYNVLAAVNSDFFHSYGVPIGMVVEDGEYKSSPEGRSAIGFSEEQGFFISEAPEVIIEIENEENDESFQLTHLNKTRYDKNGLYLYSAAFSTVSTRTETDGWAIRLRILEGELTVGGEMELEVEELFMGSEATEIGDGYLVLTAGTASNLSHVYHSFAEGDRVKLTADCDDRDIRQAQWVSGGGDILVSRGRVTDEEDWDALLSGRNPRTAAGITEDGELLLYVADGRQSGYSHGLTLEELAEEMKELGAEYAINLDGGGSSVMALRQPGNRQMSIINSPSDGQLRRSAAYIMLVSDERSDGRARRLYAAEDGAMVLTGASIPLNFLAMDSAWTPVSPGDAAAFSVSGLGSVNGNTYTAGMQAGADTLQISGSYGGGSSTLHIVDTVDALSVNDKESGELMTRLRLHCGETAQLDFAASYLGREVLTSSGAFTYGVEGDIGAIGADGVFTAGDIPGAKGNLLVSGYGIMQAIGVSIIADFQDTKGHWAEEYIDILSEAGVVSGVSGIAYAPEAHIKRGDFILMLYRAAGEPELNDFAGFMDVDPDRYYSDAVIWAGSQGIAQGDLNGNFQPEQPLNREQAMTFVWRAYAALGRQATEMDELQAAEILAGFEDEGYISDFARLPAAVLIDSGVISGSGGMLSPAAWLTRAEMAKILCISLGLAR